MTSPEFRDIVVALAQTRPNMRASTLVSLALAVADVSTGPPNLDDATALGRWALRQPTVAVEVSAGKKIHAIKELRAASFASLLQAKNAVDSIPVANWGSR